MHSRVDALVGLTPEGVASTPTTTVPTETTLPPSTTLPPATGPCNVSAGDWTHDFGAGGWSAEFWNKTSAMTSSPSDPFSGTPTVTQNVSQIYKPNNSTSPMTGVNSTTTRLGSPSRSLDYGVHHQAATSSDDGVRVKVNGSTVIDDWNDYGFKTTNVSNVPLVAGTNTIVFEFYQRSGESGYSLQWRN